MAAKGIVVEVDGSKREVELADLKDYQAAVGGWIEAIGLRTGLTGYVNEEGKIQGLEVNVLGSMLATELGWRGLPNDVLCGPVIFVGFSARSGEEVDLNPLTREVILSY